MVYNDWLLQFWVPTGLDQRDSYVSEAFAADQPYRVLFSGVEVLCAAMILAGACLVIPALSCRWALAGWTALALLAVCSIADVALPIRCAPSRETDCPVDNVAHTVTSGLVHFAVFTSIAAFVVHARSIAGRHSHAGRWARWLLPLSMIAAIASAGPYIGIDGGQGIAQRVHLVTVGVWLWLLSAEAWHSWLPNPEKSPVKGGLTG
ncbi:DUF998 domain-containing protein [Streptomyces sp. NPDC006530]|uniref:DUF998 domain-containing protein n=1 Tax=Streptomyces sp. NPDC006530 TaxID=3364750 RepID=UPI0036B19C75